MGRPIDWNLSIVIEMYSALQRLNASFFHGMTVLFFCAVACNITVWFDTYNGHYQLKELSLKSHDRPVKFLRYGPPNQILKADVAVMRFDLKVDLKPVWNWNVKQLFVFITAEYATPEHPLNQVILWDLIITEKENAVIDKQGALNKYSLFDHGHGLRDNEVTFYLNWYTVPVCGVLFSQRREANKIKLPSEYLNVANHHH